jgi:hypothetical protein
VASALRTRLNGFSDARSFPAWASLLLAVWLVSGGIAAAHTRSIDLKTRDGVTTLRGGGRVVALDDVNGDGTRDFAVADCDADHNGRAQAGSTYVVLSSPLAGSVALGTAREGVFRIDGGSSGDSACLPAGAGDVNGDGFADIVVGAPEASNNGRFASGSAYVVYGSSDPATVDLRDFDAGGQGDQGYRIDGGSSSDLAGSSVAGAGDVNGDALGDVIVGAPFAATSYVVFGRDSSVPVDLRDFDLNLQGTTGYKVETPAPARSSGYSVAGSMDVNGDGFSDTLVGVISNLYDRPGTVFLVFGKSDPLPVDVSRTFAGFTIRGARKGDGTGAAVSGAGDVNGDGLFDCLIGAPGYLFRPGRAYVVFGKRDTEAISLRKTGSWGFRISGGQPGDALGSAVSRLGDADGDGLGDVVIGAPYGGWNGRRSSGTAVVVRGKRGYGPVSLDHLHRRGYRIDGPRRMFAVGGSVAGPGDLNGDNKPELLIGSYRAKRSYLVGSRR